MQRQGASHTYLLKKDCRALVEQAVARQLVSDVPLGCFLSGGIDSSIIAAAMKHAAGDQPVLTFSIGFDDPRYDETAYAAAVARHLGTEHRQFMVTPEAAEDLPKLAAVFGEPFGDSSALPTHYLARETRRFVKAALSGDGGDEFSAATTAIGPQPWPRSFASFKAVCGWMPRGSSQIVFEPPQAFCDDARPDARQTLCGLCRVV